jgi:hypothetical protein
MAGDQRRQKQGFKFPHLLSHLFTVEHFHAEGEPAPSED